MEKNSPFHRKWQTFDILHSFLTSVPWGLTLELDFFLQQTNQSESYQFNLTIKVVNDEWMEKHKKNTPFSSKMTTDLKKWRLIEFGTSMSVKTHRFWEKYDFNQEKSAKVENYGFKTNLGWKWCISFDEILVKLAVFGKILNFNQYDKLTYY